MSSALQLVLLPHVDPFKLMYSCCNALRCCSWHAVSHVVFWEAAQPAREHNSNPENSNCKAAAMYPSDDQHPAIRQPRLDHLHACSCSCVSSSNLSSNTVSEGLSQAWTGGGNESDPAAPILPSSVGPCCMMAGLHKVGIMHGTAQPAALQASQRPDGIHLAKGPGSSTFASARDRGTHISMQPPRHEAAPGTQDSALALQPLPGAS